ncbi:MAG: proteasome accessory factor PafA2 family protein, partial [Actinomycetota bacterium]
IEDDFIPADLTISEPVAALRAVSRDPSCRATFAMNNRARMNAVELQWEFFDWAKKYCAEKDPDPVTAEVLTRWEHVLGALESEPSQLAGQLDWVAKYRMLQAYRERHGLRWSDPRLDLVDLQYHDVRAEKGLYNKMVAQGRIETLVTEDEIAEAVRTPPSDTRAFFRGSVLAKFSSEITAASWDSIMFDTGADSLKKIGMMEPLKGTRETVAPVVEASATASELLNNLDK